MLARYFQIGAHEALRVRPRWEIENLLEQLAVAEQGDGDPDVAAPAEGTGRVTLTMDEEVI